MTVNTYPIVLLLTYYHYRDLHANSLLVMLMRPSSTYEVFCKAFPTIL